MNAMTGNERSAIETRVLRLAAALIATHEEIDLRERERTPGDPRELRRALHERAQHLATMSTLLPRTSLLRLAADHAARTIEEWAAQPIDTEDGRAGSLSMVIAIAMLRRAVAETERGLPRAA